MDFGVRPRDKTPKSGVAHCKLSPSQESENEQIQNHIDAYLFFLSQGIVHKEFVPPGQTVNQIFYREVLERLRKMVARVRSGIARTWMLHHDNAPCHTTVSFQHCYEQWKQRLRHCVAAQGDYFEGDSLDL